MVEFKELRREFMIACKRTNGEFAETRYADGIALGCKIKGKEFNLDLPDIVTEEKINLITIKQFRHWLDEEYRGFQNEEQILMHEKMTSVIDELNSMVEEE